MRRREFITVLSGAATWPLAAGAQQPFPTIGFLHEGLPAPSHLTAAFQQGLVEAGIQRATASRSKTVGRKVTTIDCRYWRPT
jgi:hypothetical protein